MTLEWKSLEVLHDYFRDSAFAICAAGEDLTPQFFAVLASPEGIVRAMAAMPQICLFMSSEEGKERFAQLLPELVGDTPTHASLVQALGFAPNVFVQISEAWLAMIPPGEPHLRPASQHPDRQEIILITLHTQTGSVVVMHDIVATPRRHAVARAFPRPEDAQNWCGRFTMQETLGTHETKH